MSVAAMPLASTRGTVGAWFRGIVAKLVISRPAGICRRCGDKPRRRGRAFCSNECHTAWREADGARRGYGD